MRHREGAREVNVNMSKWLVWPGMWRTGGWLCLRALFDWQRWQPGTKEAMSCLILCEMKRSSTSCCVMCTPWRRSNTQLSRAGGMTRRGSSKDKSQRRRDPLEWERHLRASYLWWRSGREQCSLKSAAHRSDPRSWDVMTQTGWGNVRGNQQQYYLHQEGKPRLLGAQRGQTSDTAAGATSWTVWAREHWSV